MKTMIKLLVATFLLVEVVFAQTNPVITAWIRNTTSAKGYNNIESNVQVVQYTTQNVYVSSTCIPDYSIGPWAQNPNTPSNQSFITKFTLTPSKNTGTATSTPMGNIGMWTNGVAIFNPKDGYYWDNTTNAFKNQGVGTWNRNALYYEGVSFDNCLGHPNQTGTYHHHVSPNCLYDQTDNTKHSPIIGFAFDGFPIYGAYGYTNTDGTGPIKRIQSSYVMTVGGSRSSGPPVNSTYPRGSMCEDYVYTVGAGDLDEHNGRICVTPEYPSGTYAYFVTIDANLDPVYPFVLGPTYYGVVQTGSHNVVPSGTTVYTGTLGIEEKWNTTILSTVYPNPTSDIVYISMNPNSINNVKVQVYNLQGKVIQSMDYLQPSFNYSIDLSKEMKGVYFLSLESQDGQKVTHRIIKK